MSLYLWQKIHQACTFGGLKSSLTCKEVQSLIPRKCFHLLSENWHDCSIFGVITVDSLSDIMAAWLFFKKKMYYVNNDSTKTTFTWIVKEIHAWDILEVLVQESTCCDLA